MRPEPWPSLLLCLRRMGPGTPSMRGQTCGYCRYGLTRVALDAGSCPQTLFTSESVLGRSRQAAAFAAINTTPSGVQTAPERNCCITCRVYQVGAKQSQ